MKLIDLIKENPNMPIYIYREMQDGIDDFAYFPIDKCNAEIKDLTFMVGQWLDRETYREKLTYNAKYDEEYRELFAGLTEEEIEQKCEEFVHKAGYIKSIVIYEE